MVDAIIGISLGVLIFTAMAGAFVALILGIAAWIRWDAARHDWLGEGNSRGWR